MGIDKIFLVFSSTEANTSPTTYEKFSIACYDMPIAMNNVQSLQTILVTIW